MTRRVLLVDDDHSIRTVATLYLERHGWEVEVAVDGDEGLERASSGRYDVVLLDQRMPGLSGMEVARALRAAGTSAHLVLFSAYLTPEFEDEADALGIVTVSKSDITTLNEVLEAVQRRS